MRSSVLTPTNRPAGCRMTAGPDVDGVVVSMVPIVVFAAECATRRAPGGTPPATQLPCLDADPGPRGNLVAPLFHFASAGRQVVRGPVQHQVTGPVRATALLGSSGS